MDHFCVTTYSPRDGIVLWELQEQKCQQRVCQYTGVVQTGQAGWIVLILQWEMVKLKGRSALVIALLVANTKKNIFVKNCGSYFIYKLLKPSGCNSRYCSADWMWSKQTSRSKRNHKSLRRYMYVKFWHVRYSTFLLYRKHYHQILTLVANRYLSH